MVPTNVPPRSLEAVAATSAITLERQRILDAAELKVRSERRLGELLRATPLDRGGCHRSARNTHGTGTVTLAQLEVTKHTSVKTQGLASISDESFEMYLAATRAAGVPATAAGVLRAAREALEPRTRKREPRPVDTRAFRRFARHMTAARRLARDFVMDEQVAALAAAETLVRQLDVMFDLERQNDGVSLDSKVVKR